MSFATPAEQGFHRYGDDYAKAILETVNGGHTARELIDEIMAAGKIQAGASSGGFDIIRMRLRERLDDLTRAGMVRREIQRPGELGGAIYFETPKS